MSICGRSGLVGRNNDKRMKCGYAELCQENKGATKRLCLRGKNYIISTPFPQQEEDDTQTLGYLDLIAFVQSEELQDMFHKKKMPGPKRQHGRKTSESEWLEEIGSVDERSFVLLNIKLYTINYCFCAI